MGAAYQMGMIAAGAAYHAMHTPTKKRRHSDSSFHTPYLTQAWQHGSSPITISKKVSSIMNPTIANTRNISAKGSIKSDKEGGITFSKTKYPSGKNFKKYGHDKSNCSRGTITHNYGGRIDCPPARQGWALLNSYSDETLTAPGMKFTKPSEWKAFRAIPKDYTTAIADLPGGITKRGNGNYVQCVWQKIDTEFVNNNTHPVTLTLYDLQSRQEQMNLSPDALGLMSRTATQYGGAPNTGTKVLNSTQGGRVDLEDLGMTERYNLSFVPIGAGGKDIWKFWRCHNLTQIYMKPGDRHIHTTFHKKNWTWDEHKYKNDDGVSGMGIPSYYKFNTTKLLVNTKGHVVKFVNTAPVAEEDRGLTTIDGAKLLYFEKVTTYLRDMNRFEEHYQLDATNAYFGTGQAQKGIPGFLDNYALNTTQVIEDDEMVDVIGDDED